MPKLSALLVSGLAAITLVSTGRGQEPPASTSARIGTFDSRAVATAFYRSAEFQESARALWAELDEARSTGDEWRVRELETYGPAMQHRMHQQGFSTGSVIEIVDRIRDDLPEIAQETGVSAIVSKWEVAYAGPTADFVDVTPQIVALFGPSEQTASIVESYKRAAPLPMDQFLVSDVEEGSKLSVAEAMRDVIAEQGVGAGVTHYRELRKAAIERYQELQEAAAKEYNFAEAELNNLGYEYLGQGETDTAIEIFKLNVEAYPAGYNTYDSLGEAYMEDGQTELAIENYERSLELNPDNDNAREMIERMGADVDEET